MKPAEINLYDFLKDTLDASASDSLLYELELHDTIHQSITKPLGVRISEAVGMLAPGPGGGLKEVDVDLILICYAKIAGNDKKQRQDALQQVFDISVAVVTVLNADTTLGGRGCEVLVKRGSRGYDVFDGNPYAVANIPLLINPSGARYTE